MSVSLATQAQVQLRPLASADLPALWAMLHEHPEAHMDDTTPRTEQAFCDELQARRHRGERIWAVDVDGMAGAIGYAPMTARTGMLHGVCVARRVSGKGVADAALCLVLEQLQAEGVRKVSASYFVENRHIRACLKRVGFVDEGYLRDQTTQGGVPVSLWLVAKLLKG